MNVNTLEFKYIRMYLNTNTENENSIPSNDIPVQTVQEWRRPRTRGRRRAGLSRHKHSHRGMSEVKVSVTDLISRPLLER